MQVSFRSVLLGSVFSIFVATANVQAADKDGNYAMWGVAGSTCHHYNKARKAGEDENYKNFIMGYFTAYNTLAEDTYRISGRHNLTEVMEKFDAKCKVAPVNGFELTLTQIVGEMHKNRIKSARKGKVGIW